MNWQGWFKRWGGYVIKARFYENESEFRLDEMYLMFKARMEAECGKTSDQPMERTRD